MPRLSHGAIIPVDQLRAAREAVARVSGETPLGFAAVRPAETQDFDFLFRELQDDPANLLPESRETRDNLVRLGQTMRDESGNEPGGDSDIPAAYTYFGQFVDHDITLETESAALSALLSPELAPLPLKEITKKLQNARTPALDLDSVYAPPAPRDGAKMAIGRVTALNGSAKPILRPPGKSDDHDLPREPRGMDPKHDRAALIGDPRNDENTIIAQLQLAFLRANNTLIDQGKSVRQARRLLRQHYQHMVLHDFLKRIADPQTVDDTIAKNRIYDALAEPFFFPLEFSVAAYRFGHSMVRAEYDFNLNFNTSGEPGTFPASLDLLFTFTALSGGLGVGNGNETLPDNWIIEWENLVDAGKPFNRARRVDTQLVEPLFQLRDLLGQVEPGDGARLAVRNLLRGYLLRMPTGQAVARVLREKLEGIRDIPVLTSAQVEEGAASEDQRQVLRETGFSEHTPLWYYLLAEAAVLGQGQRLGPAGSTIVAEVLVGLVRRSGTSILRAKDWRPTLPSTEPGTFTLVDLLRLGGVLPTS